VETLLAEAGIREAPAIELAPAIEPAAKERAPAPAEAEAEDPVAIKAEPGSPAARATEPKRKAADAAAAGADAAGPEAVVWYWKGDGGAQNGWVAYDTETSAALEVRSKRL
jgi:hypothetical protein